MHNRMYRHVAAFLSLVMLLGLLAIPSLADNEISPNEYGIEHYVALGDSIATGLNDNTETNEDAYGSWENGYTVKLAEKLNLLTGTPSYYPKGYDTLYYTSPNGSGFRSWAFPAMRTLEIRHQVDASYEYERDRFADYWLDNGELNEAIQKEYNCDVGELIRRDIAQADLITLNIGSNDVLLSQLRITAWELEDKFGVGSSAIVDLMKSKLGFGDAPTLPEGVDENKLVLEFIPKFLVNVLKGYNQFLQQMPKILKALRDQAPEAQIVVLGIFNPLHHSLSLTDGKLPVSLGEMIDGVMLPVNLAMAADAALYGCTYVDVVDVTTDGSMHPDNEGYVDIADRIEKRLRAKTAYKDIRILSGENQAAVRWGYETNNFPGLSEKYFHPAMLATRAQVAETLYHMAGNPGAAPVQNFIDVKEKADYYDAVQWSVANGIVSGLTKNTFSPGVAISLKKLATALYQYDKYLMPNDQSGLTDGYDDALTWASATGISSGISKVAMKTALATRAQAVLMIYRYAQLRKS